jgi:hypothetical protein
MTPDVPVAEFVFDGGELRGAQLTLYANRIVYQGADAMEIVPLAQLAAARVQYERDVSKLGWGLALAGLALAFALVAGPLQGWSVAAAAEVAEQARREAGSAGVPGVLHATLRALGAAASLLPALAAALAVAAAALAVLFWLGRTTFTLCFGALERSYPVRGRNAHLHEFAEAVSACLATLQR